MQKIPVRFDRIFDFVRVGGKNPYTAFGFQNSHMKQCGVQVDGWPEIKEGMELSIVLRDPEDWTTIIGWRNEVNGELFLPGMWHSLIFCFVILFLIIFAALAIVNGNLNNFEAVSILILLWLFTFNVSRFREKWKARDMLNKSVLESEI